MPRALRMCARCGAEFRPRPEVQGPHQSSHCGKCREGLRLGIIGEGQEAVPVPPAEPAEERLQTCQAGLNRALRKLDEVKEYRRELVETVRQAAADAAAGLQLEPVPYWKGGPSMGARTHAPESAILALGDWQGGKTTPSYSTAILEERMERYGDAVERITRIQRSDHLVEEARIYLLGDLIEGEMIFPGQAHRIDASLYRQVLMDGPRILGNLVRRALGIFPTVRVVGVIGNHGRLGGRVSEYHPESNGDAMMYEATRQRLAGEDRLEWDAPFTPGERHWYAIDEVQGHRFFLFHGDQIKTPLYANVFQQAVLRWQNMYRFTYSLSGHYHTPMRIKVGSGTHWASGSVESDNTFAAEFVKAQGTPSQWLLFVHPRRGVSAEYEVRLDEQKAVAA